MCTVNRETYLLLVRPFQRNALSPVLKQINKLFSYLLLALLSTNINYMNTILSSLFLLLFVTYSPERTIYPLANSATQTQTVAIYSSDNSFFDDYPIDTLVNHLNYLNRNPHISYCKNSLDDSRTGFGADYIVDLKLTFNEANYVIPKITEVPITRQIMRAITEPGGSVRYEIDQVVDHYENVVEHNTSSRSYYYLAMQAIRKTPYQKMKLVKFEDEGGLKGKAKMIIALINKLSSITDPKK